MCRAYDKIYNFSLQNKDLISIRFQFQMCKLIEVLLLQLQLHIKALITTTSPPAITPTTQYPPPPLPPSQPAEQPEAAAPWKSACSFGDAATSGTPAWWTGGGLGVVDLLQQASAPAEWEKRVCVCGGGCLGRGKKSTEQIGV